MAADERRAEGLRRTTPPPLDLEDLLQDMRELRLTLAADLSTAAGAAEAGADAVVSDILAGEQRDLAAFLRRSRSTLAAMAATPEPVDAAPAGPARGGWRRRALVALPAIPLAGAIGISAAAAAGLLPLPHHAGRGTATVGAAAPAAQANAPVSLTFHTFESVVHSDPSASEVVAAASVLHQQLEQLLAAAPRDPAGAKEVAKLLEMEQALLIRTQPPGSAKVLAESRKLAARLVVIVATAQPSQESANNEMQPPHQQHATPRPTSTAPAPAPSQTPSTAPSPATTTAPSSSPTASPSPSSSDAGHLPTLGN